MDDDLPDSSLTYTESLERDITRAETLAAHLQADLTVARARIAELEATERLAQAVFEENALDGWVAPYSGDGAQQALEALRDHLGA